MNAAYLCSSMFQRARTTVVLAILVASSSTALADADRLHRRSSSAFQVPSPKIAVIGAGIGGASTAYYLRSLFGDKTSDDDVLSAAGCDIDVYEASAGRVGGRLAVATVAGEQYETGGSIIHPRNHYMVEFVKLLGLETKQSPVGRSALFDGKEYLFMESDWTIVNYAKLLWRYGLSLVRLQSFIDDMLNHFSNIYVMQDRGESFETVDELLSAMNPLFVNLTTITARSYLRSLDFSELFIDEMFTGITRVNYGQSPELNAFVGAVALAGVQSGLWSIKGGNYQVPERLLKAAKVNLIFSKVTTISLRSDKRFNVTTASDIDEAVAAVYDIVFVCTPLTADNMSGIAFAGFDPTTDQPRLETFDGQYERTIATLVRGSLNTTELLLKSTSDVDDVLTTSTVHFFNSLSLNHPVRVVAASTMSSTSPPSRTTNDVWKVFSPRLLTDVELDSLFADRSETLVTDWLAYPHYEVNKSTDHRYGQFVLYPKLYYTNCIEWAASAMEMSAIAGRNVATLAFKHWVEIFDNQIDWKKPRERRDPLDEGNKVRSEEL